MNLKRSADPETGEELYTGTLSNGLRLAVQPKPGYQRKFALFSTRYGSIDTKFVPPGSDQAVRVPDGVAHFLEHKLFEAEDGNADDRFSELGASCNAYTSFTKTSYLFSTVDRFEECLRLLVRFVGHPYFTGQSVEKEKGIIEQEIRMYEDSPYWRVFFNLLEVMLPEHPAHVDIAGSVESVRAIDPDVLYLCYRTFYHPSNMLVHVLGDIDPEPVVSMIEQESGGEVLGNQPAVERFYSGDGCGKSGRRIEQRMEVSRPLFSVGFREEQKLGGLELVKRDLLTEVVLEAISGLAAPLYNRLYEKGLINDTFDFEHSDELSYGFTRLGGETGEPERLEAELVEGISLLRAGGLDQGQFERARRKLTGELLRSHNSPDRIAEQYANWSFRDADPLKAGEILANLSYEQAVQRLQEHFDPDRSYVSIVRPR